MWCIRKNSAALAESITIKSCYFSFSPLFPFNPISAQSENVVGYSYDEGTYLSVLGNTAGGHAQCGFDTGVYIHLN